MAEVKIRSGTRIKLKKVDEDGIDREFMIQLKETAQQHEMVEAIFLFSMQKDDGPENICLSIAMKKKIFGDSNEEFLAFVDEIQIILPEDLPLNIYRFSSSEFLASFCAHKVEPCHLRSRTWLSKQQKKYPPPTS